MKRFILAYIVLTLLLIFLCTGCAAPTATLVQYSYSAVNAGTSVATQKSIPDHALSAVTGGECSFLNIFQGLYYCEMPTYNRSGL
jgi:hypothetical protein